MKDYKRQHIIKHALEMYIERPDADEKSLNQERSVLNDVKESISNMKDQYGIKGKEEIADEI